MPRVQHSTRDGEWFARRALKRHAGVLQLWALGVGAVISGDFFGWNFGFAAGGFGGMMTALIVMTVLYLGLCYSIAEMSPALPHTGGAYSFARTTMGPWGGYITGLAENMEYILTPTTIVVGIGGYLGSIFGTPKSFEPLWWLVCFIVFVSLNIWGIELSFRISVLVTLCALAILAIFYVTAVPQFSLARITAAPLFPKGWSGVLGALPFALWLYLGIEQLPLAAEESHDPKRDMPRGILWALFTLIVCSFLTPIVSAGIPPGPVKMGESSEPLILGFQSIFGAGALTKLLALFACTGLVASFHAIIYAYGRQIYSLARAGYFPPWLSQTHATRKTPHRALIAGAVLGYATALVIWFAGQNSAVGATLLNMAVFGAVLAYVMQMLSFIRLRIKLAHIDRPYVSPLGIPGAAVAGLISIVTLGALFLNRDMRNGVLGAAAWFLCGILWFALYARDKLILSPEEQFAFEHEIEIQPEGAGAD